MYNQGAGDCVGTQSRDSFLLQAGDVLIALCFISVIRVCYYRDGLEVSFVPAGHAVALSSARGPVSK